MPKFTLLLLTALCWMLTACADRPPAAQMPEDPQALLKTAVDAIQAADSFRMTIEQTGSPYPMRLSFDGVNMLTAELQRGAAQYVSPNELFIQVKLDIGVTAVIDLFSRGDHQWIRLVGGAPWLTLPVAEDFDISRLMARGDGLEYAMTHLNAPQILGEAALIDGTQTFHIRATASGETVQGLLFGLLEPKGEVQIDVHIRTDSQHPALLEMTMPTADDAEPAVWRIEFYDYDAPRDFEGPPEGS